MSGKFSRGLAIASDSLDLFRANPRLAVLPLCSLLFVGSGFAVAAGIALHFGLVASVLTNDLLTYAAIFVWFALTSSLGTFFNAAVAHCAFQHFDGDSPTVRDGLRAAWDARRAIAVWAVTAATLGTVLYILDEKFGVLGSAARFAFDLGWALLTFFVVPVIVTEDTADIRDILRESGTTFKETWGESITVTFGIGLATFPFVLVGVACLAIAYTSRPALGAWLFGAAGFVLVVGSIVTSQVLGMIARSALYEYATEGRCVGPFTERDPTEVMGDS